MFILLSLLAHAILIIAILLITRFMPVPKMRVAQPETTTLTLTPMAPPTAPPKKIFIPTTPDANTKHKEQLVESANDRDLTSKNQTARKPDTIMPDVTGKPHAPNLTESPEVKAPPKPEVSSTPPTPKQDKPDKPIPPQPNPSTGKEVPKTPPPPNAKPEPPKPAPPAKPQQLVDENGFPVLPPINAPTLAPPNSAAQPLAPIPSDRQQAADAHGAVGLSGDTSPAAMATALGKYKQKVYAAVGSRWYPKVDNSLQLLGVGIVHIQFTIHSDGSVDTKVLDGGNANMQMLLSISVNSIREAAPFDPFPPEMVKQLISEQGGDGTSYTDDFSFSVYGN